MAPLRVLVVGDSLTAGLLNQDTLPDLEFEPYGTTLAAEMGCAVQTCAASGSTTRELLEHAVHAEMIDAFENKCGAGVLLCLREFKPTVAVILSGTNDLAGGQPVDSIAADIAELHALCRANGAARTVALTVPPNFYSIGEFHGPPLRGCCRDPAHAELNDKIVAMCEQTSGMSAVDLDLGPITLSADAIGPDSLHLTRDAYHTIARAVALQLA